MRRNIETGAAIHGSARTCYLGFTYTPSLTTGLLFYVIVTKVVEVTSPTRCPSSKRTLTFYCLPLCNPFPHSAIKFIRAGSSLRSSEGSAVKSTAAPRNCEIGSKNNSHFSLCMAEVAGDALHGNTQEGHSGRLL